MGMDRLMPRNGCVVIMYMSVLTRTFFNDQPTNSSFYSYMIPTHILPTFECPLCLKPLFFDLMLPYLHASLLCTLYKAIRFSIKIPALMLQRFYWAESMKCSLGYIFVLAKRGNE